MRAFAFAAVAAAGLLFQGWSAASAQEKSSEGAFKATTLRLSAKAETQAKPDRARLNLGISVEAPTAKAAMAEAALRMQKAIAALTDAGVEKRDIQTHSINLHPRYDDRPSSTRKIVAQRAETMLTVNVRKPADAGALIDASVDAGVNRVHGLSFDFTDSDAAERATREAALRKLKDDAAAAADIMGYRVSRLVSLTVNDGGGRPRPVYASYRAADTLARAATPVEPGEVTLTAHANGVFELTPK